MSMLPTLAGLAVFALTVGALGYAPALARAIERRYRASRTRYKRQPAPSEAPAAR